MSRRAPSQVVAPASASVCAPASAPGSRPDRGALAVAGALVALTFLAGCFEAWDTDLWWHLRTGQLIWQRLEVPRADWFTFTAGDAPWIDLHWGFQLLVAGIHALGGIPLLVLAKALCGAAVVALSLASMRRDAPLETAVAAWLPALVVLSGRLYERPETLSLLFLAAFLAVLAQGGRHPKLLWALPLLQLAWSNVHALSVLGPFVLVCAFADLGARRLAPAARVLVPLGGDGTPWIEPRTLAGPALAAVAAAFVNPYAERGVFFPLELLAKIGGEDGFYRNLIGELQPVGDFLLRFGPFASPYLFAFLVVLAAAAASFVALARRGGRVSVFRLLLALAFAWLGWSAKRNSALFALVLATVTAWNLADAWPVRRWARAGRVALAAALALAFVALVSGSFYDLAGEGRRVGLGERADWFAHDACRALARPGMPETMLVYDLGQAAVCLYHAGPERKVFIDPRLELNSRQTLERYLAIADRMAAGDRAWTTLLGLPPRAEAMPSVLLDRATSSAQIDALAADPRWRAVYADAMAVVFVTVARAEQAGFPPVAFR